MYLFLHGNKFVDLKINFLFVFLLLGIGIYVSLLIFYTFKTLFFSGLVYCILIPISYFHYKHKNKTSLITSNEEETEDIL